MRRITHHASAVAAAIALAAAPARADVTVIYAPAAPPAPLVARSIGPCERAEPAPAATASPRAPVTAAAITPAPATPAPAPVVGAPVEAAPVEAAPVEAAPVEAAAVVPGPVGAVAAPPSASPAGPASPAIDAPAPSPVPAALVTRCTAPRPITLVREGTDERATLTLTDCSGASDPESLAELSVLARPRTLETRPSARELAEHAGDREWVAAGVRRLHPGLAERVRALADRFPEHAIEIVAGFRPDAREGSRHLVGLALDVRVVGASLDAVHALVRRFDRTGVGLHRSGGFVHLDVRTRSMHWIDESAPGEPARIVEDDAPRRGAIVRAPDPTGGGAPMERSAIATAGAHAAAPDTVAIDTTAIEPATTDGAATDGDAAIDEADLDADALADEVLRGLGELSLPSGPAR